MRGFCFLLRYIYHIYPAAFSYYNAFHMTSDKKHNEADAQNTSDSTPHETAADCIFCAIIAGKIPADKVFEDDETFAFVDINPTNEGHTLVVPKDHFENVYTVPPETWCRVMLTVQKMALAVRAGVNADGVNIIMNNEAAAGQIVHHAHVHVIPRHNDDGLKHWQGKPYKSAAESATVAEKIKGELKGI